MAFMANWQVYLKNCLYGKLDSTHIYSEHIIEKKISEVMAFMANWQVYKAIYNYQQRLHNWANLIGKKIRNILEDLMSHREEVQNTPTVFLFFPECGMVSKFKWVVQTNPKILYVQRISYA